MSNCPEDNDIIEYLDAELPAERTAEIEQHISRCAECTQAVVVWSNFRKQLLQESEDSASEDFVARIMTRIIPVQRRSFWGALFDFSLHWQSQLIAVAAALLLIIVQETSTLKRTNESAIYGNSAASNTCDLLSAEECSFEEFLGVNGEI